MPKAAGVGGKPLAWLAKPSSALVCLAMLCGCSIARLEDVPSAQAIDARALGNQVQDLTAPPDMAQATVEAAPSLYTAETEEPAMASAEPAVMEELPKTRLQAQWTVRYRDGGFDAENAEGGICSGRSETGAASLTRTAPVELACNDGRLASLVVESYLGSEAQGSLNFGTSTDTAVIIVAQ